MVPVALQECSPRSGPFRRRLDPMLLQDVANGARRDPMAHVSQSAFDAAVAPAAVLFGEAHDQRPNLLHDPGPPDPLRWIGPLRRDQASSRVEDWRGGS